jgi:hypothetical protein
MATSKRRNSYSNPDKITLGERAMEIAIKPGRQYEDSSSGLRYQVLEAPDHLLPISEQHMKVQHAEGNHGTIRILDHFDDKEL